MKIHVSVQVRGIEADSYNEAAIKAFNLLSMEDALHPTMKAIGINEREQFLAAARVAKEANSTYTVTVP